MTDLVERLREVGRDGVWKSGRNPKTAHPMCIKAADRIEAQAAEIKAILDREADTYRRHDAKVDALEAENERLREVLREVTPPPHFGESEQNKAWWAKARAALGDMK